jgi:Protein of unknown function (DUF2786)
MSLYRAQKLIDLACSTTHDEEARTAALAACRLIRKHGLRLTAEPAHAEPRSPRRAREQAARREAAEPTRRQPAEPAREKPPNGGAWAQADRFARCDSCGSAISAGEDVYVVAGATWCARH